MDTIRQGSKWLCIKDLIVATPTNKILFRSGKIYKSVEDNLIMNEFGSPCGWRPELSEFFRLIPRNKRWKLRAA